MKFSKIIWAMLLLVFCSFLYCGNPSESRIANNGGNLGMGGSAGDGSAGLQLNLGGFDEDGGIAGAAVYMLPSDFTRGVFGGYKLGSEINLDGTSGAAGSAGQSSTCGTQIMGVVRDFRGNNEPNGHPDFEHFSGSGASLGIVNPALGMDQKPVYSSSGPFIDLDNGQQTTSKLFFDQWYTSSAINKTYIIYFYFEPNKNILTFHSNAFFPLDNSGFGNGPNSHNFGFTTEIHTAFDYKGGETFNFTGDDDVWVFINNKLSIDLGGLHPQVSKSISLNLESAKLNIKIGNNYNLDVFQSERHTNASNYRIDTNLSFTNCGIINSPK